jgi:hypothetical protein
MHISHSAQHFLKASEEAKESLLIHRKSMHLQKPDNEQNASYSEEDEITNEEDKDKYSLSLGEFVHQHGYTSFSDP